MSDADGGHAITALILTYNEELHIARCIELIRPLVSRIVVIDSFSTDKTLDIAGSLGADVLTHPFKNHAAQFQWGMDNANVTTPWTLRIDCDEYLEPGLVAAIKETLPQLPPETVACDVKLKVIFKGKFIRWGGYYRTRLTRLWRTGAAQMEQRWMDERFIVHGETCHLHGGDLVDENLNDISWWTDKHNRYATRQMVDFVTREYGLFSADHRLAEGRSQVGWWKRFLREKVFGKAPLYLRSVLYFLQRYFLNMGFLDGRQGFVWHFLQGFWYFVLMDVKIDEARTYIAKHGVDRFREKLKAQFGADAFDEIS
jgi:glycosyltransferase involved in cell wall biosynthesis